MPEIGSLVYQVVIGNPKIRTSPVVSSKEEKLSLEHYWNSLSHCYSESELEEAFMPFRKSYQISQAFEGYLGFVDTRTKRSILHYGDCEEITGCTALFFATDPVAQLVSGLSHSIRQGVKTMLDQMVRYLNKKELPLTDIVEITLCGVELLVNKKILIKLQPALYDPEGSLAVISLILKDVSYLTFLEDSWCRVLTKKGATYVANSYKCTEGDIFTSRELDVLRTLQQRKSNDYTARKLGISSNTVIQHQKNMMHKMGTIDRSSLLHLSSLIGLL